MSRKWWDAQRRHFDRQLSAYTIMYGSDSPFHRAMTERLLDFAIPRIGEEVLDVGCGVGRVTVPLLQSGCRVTGLDVSRPTLDAVVARVRSLGLADGFRPVCQPVEALESKERYDLVIGRGILHHLEDPVPVLKKLQAALLPGGRMVFMDPNPYHPGWIPFILVHPTLSWSIERYMLRGTPARTRWMLESAGLVDVECAFCGLLPPPLWGLLPGAGELERRLMAFPGLGRLALYLQVRGYRPEGG